MITKYNNAQPTGVEEPQGGNGQRDALLHVKEVAELLGVHPNTVRGWTESGVLIAYRVGPRRDRRIPMTAVRRLLEPT